MQIERMSADNLKAADYNPRKDLKPGDAEFEKLKRSIEEFGYVEPVIWNKRTGNVVGGHQRLKVLKVLGHTVEKVLRKPITDDTPEIVKTAVLYCVWQYYFHRDDGEFNAAGIESTVAVMLSDLRGDVF